MQFRRMFPRTLGQAKPSVSKRLSCGIGVGRVFAAVAFLVIETLHTQISALFLGKTEQRWLIRCPEII